MDGQPRGLGHIAGDEIRAALHQVGDECHVAGEAVQAGDKQHGAALAALGEGGEELGPVGVTPAAFDLGVFGHELAVADEPGDGLALCVQA